MAMSLSSTLSNFLSFISPTKPPSQPPQQPPQLNLPPSPTTTPFPSSQTLKTKHSNNSVKLSQQQHQHVPSSCSCCDELSSVICPSLAYSNMLFFNSKFNVEGFVNEDESEEKLLDMFRRDVIPETKTRSFNSKTNTSVYSSRRHPLLPTTSIKKR